ncbi:hypothetical protein [Streptosporangium jomthongense]|uniref:Uncharacterized protein n=1 Tax=Streptosporangium jomthongense TaxID=1193683 RepID=A0ABV8FB48_9ACTN
MTPPACPTCGTPLPAPLDGPDTPGQLTIFDITPEDTREDQPQP